MITLKPILNYIQNNLEDKMRKTIFAMLMLCLFTTLTFAQSTNGRLIGTVSGPDGLIPGASVTVTDDQTGRELTAQTGDDGGFRFDQLPFGNYTVKVTANGFKTFVATGVKIDANRDYSLKPVMELGSIEAQVTVQAGADIINSTNAELSIRLVRDKFRLRLTDATRFLCSICKQVSTRQAVPSMDNAHLQQTIRVTGSMCRIISFEPAALFKIARRLMTPENLRLSLKMPVLNSAAAVHLKFDW